MVRIVSIFHVGDLVVADRRISNVVYDHLHPTAKSVALINHEEVFVVLCACSDGYKILTSEGRVGWVYKQVLKTIDTAQRK